MNESNDLKFQVFQKYKDFLLNEMGENEWNICVPVYSCKKTNYYLKNKFYEFHVFENLLHLYDYLNRGEINLDVSLYFHKDKHFFIDT